MPSYPAEWLLDILLQWGRDLWIAEMLQIAAVVPAIWLLQCGRGLSIAEIKIEYLLFDRRYLLQWGRDLSIAEMGTHFVLGLGGMARFNGAAIFRSRKSSIELYNGIVDITLQWGRDLSTAEIRGWGLVTRREEELQWGRDLSSAEIVSLGVRARCPAVASMGPRSFERGNVEPSRICRRALLQWGRDLSSAEMGWQGSAPRRGKPLLLVRWGRDLSTRKSRLGNTVLIHQPRFNGAAILRSRKCRLFHGR